MGSDMHNVYHVRDVRVHGSLYLIIRASMSTESRKREKEREREITRQEASAGSRRWCFVLLSFFLNLFHS